jgi:hypothetical protein
LVIRRRKNTSILWHLAAEIQISETRCATEDKTLTAASYLAETLHVMKFMFTTLLAMIVITVNAQYDPDYKRKSELDPYHESSPVNLGVGMGLSYGGFGARISIFPVDRVGVFGAVGYNLHKAGYNVGGIVRILPKGKFCPVVMFMYGYNGVIIVQGLKELNQTYYGPTVGSGMEFHFGNRPNFLNVELLVPIRSEQWRRDVDYLLNHPDIEMTEPLPIAISVGYHIKI